MKQRDARVPLGRVAVGEDVAKTAAFLASSESDYLTGSRYQRRWRFSDGLTTQIKEDYMYNLNGKVALVTGAGGEHGIGRAIATRLAKEGADVIVNDVVSDPYAYDSNDWEGVPSVVREIEALGRQAATILADVSDADQVDVLVDEGIERFGHIDIFVNNAGSRPGPDRVPVVDLEEEAWDTVHGVNLKGTFLCCRAVARHLISRGGGGKIITVSSMLGKQGFGTLCSVCRLQIRSDWLHASLGTRIGTSPY